MKKVFGIISVFMLVIIIMSSSYTIYANPYGTTGNPFTDAKNFLQTGADYPGMLQETSKLKSLFDSLFGFRDDTKQEFEKLIDFLWGLGLLVIFASTVILGIKYMIVTPEEKSRIKQATTPYIIGVVVIFGALTIWQLVIVVLEGSM